MATNYTIKIKQDYYEDVESFREHLNNAYFAVMDFIRCGEDMSISDLINNLYVIEHLLRNCEIEIEEA